jgi:hypothetical protein
LSIYSSGQRGQNFVPFEFHLMPAIPGSAMTEDSPD